VRINACRVLVPETSPDLDNLSMTRQDDVWFSWQVSNMQAKSIPKRMHEPPNHHLGFGTLTENLAHVFAAPAAGDCVGHGSKEESASLRH